jgi:hypothetical protein
MTLGNMREQSQGQNWKRASLHESEALFAEAV